MNKLPTATELMKDYLDFSPREAQAKSTKAPTEVFIKMGQDKSLEAFQTASKSVPAYKDFLKKNKVKPENIKSYSDFQQVPLTNKENYLSKYPLKDRLLGGNYVGKASITSSSGSSGKPFYWPRMPIQDFGAAKGFDSFLVNSFDIDKKSTLHINCSGMGVWTAGDYVAMLDRYLSYKYPNNSSISPGIDLDNTTQLIKDVGPDFDQVIVYGYPPFIKDLVDNLPAKIFSGTSFKLVLYGETFTESLRDYLLKKVKSTNDQRTVVSILGTSEAGIVGIEEPNSVLVRQTAESDKTLSKKLFNTDIVPCLVQFNPMSKMVEIVGSQIVMTFLAGLPLIRYDTKDAGGIITAEEIETLFSKTSKKSYAKTLDKENIPNTKLPFLYVSGRSDFAATIYGVSIVPEMIKDSIAKDDLAELLSGKFVMQTKYDQNSDQYLEIIAEIKKDKSVNDIKTINIDQKIAKNLQTVCSEYGKLFDAMGDRVIPHVICKNYGDQEYFSSKNKHKYLIK